MTAQQAAHVMMELSSAYRQRLEEPTLRQYIKRIAKLDYERALSATDYCIEHHRYIPSIAEFMDAYRAVRGEGIPNAAAYYANPPTSRFSNEDAFAAWRQTRILELDDETYWRFTIDHSFRRIQDAAWRREWFDQEKRSDATG